MCILKHTVRRLVVPLKHATYMYSLKHTVRRLVPLHTACMYSLCGAVLVQSALLDTRLSRW